MPAQLTTRAQVNGYRFLLRRLDHALVRRDVRMLHDPMRSQLRSLIVGAILGVLVIAGAVILSFIRPQGSIGDSTIVMGKETGALYVVVTDQQKKQQLHPVLNLASARLISGSSESPSSVKDDKLGTMPRGPLLGIPGAPAALPGSGQGDHSEWSLCEAVQLSSTGSAATSAGVITTVLAGEPELNDRVRRANKDEALLARRDGKVYLIYDGKRAEVNTADAAVARSLDLSTYKARPVGTGLLDAAEAVPPLTVPDIPGAGGKGQGALSDVPVGGVIAVSGVGNGAAQQMYVVLTDGVQPVSEFAAQVLRTANSQGMREIKAVAPDVLTDMPVRHTLALDHFPERAPEILAAEDAPISCIDWSKNHSTGATEGPNDRAVVSLLAGTELPLPVSAAPVPLATQDGTGDRVDATYVPPTTGEFVQVTGMEPGSPRRASLFYVADNGIRYAVPDIETAKILGLGDKPRLAPWAVIGQLVPGPTLSQQNALVSHDTLPTGN